MPQAWHQQAPASDADTREIALHTWWQSLNSPGLDALVAEALAGNLNIAQARQRLQQEEALASHAGARFLPALSATASVLQDAAATESYFHAGLEMTWEPGLFGTASNSKLSSSADVLSARAQEQAARVAVVAGVVRSYLDLGYAAQQTKLLQSMIEAEHRTQELAAIRARTHLGGEDIALEARQQAGRLSAELALVNDAADRAAWSLAILLGRTAPDPSWRHAIAMAKVPAFRLKHVPADLLRTRPDIQQAEATVLSAAAELGLARAALYPRFALAGSLLYTYNLTHGNSPQVDSIFPVWPVIDIPLWDWGLRRSRVTAGEHRLEAELLAYRQTVLSSIAEAEGALAAMARQQERTDALGNALLAQDEHAQAQRVLAGLGLASDFDALAIQRSRLQLELERNTADASYGLAFVALYKALGGAPLPKPAGQQP